MTRLKFARIMIVVGRLIRPILITTVYRIELILQTFLRMFSSFDLAFFSSGAFSRKVTDFVKKFDRQLFVVFQNAGR